jgi:hypothetical protein
MSVFPFTGNCSFVFIAKSGLQVLFQQVCFPMKHPHSHSTPAFSTLASVSRPAPSGTTHLDIITDRLSCNSTLWGENRQLSLSLVPDEPVDQVWEMTGWSSSSPGLQNNYASFKRNLVWNIPPINKGKTGRSQRHVTGRTWEHWEFNWFCSQIFPDTAAVRFLLQLGKHVWM